MIGAFKLSWYEAKSQNVSEDVFTERFKTLLVSSSADVSTSAVAVA